MIKTCTNPKCKQVGPQTLDSFASNRLRKDGHQSWCKVCTRGAVSAYQKKHPGRKNAHTAKRKAAKLQRTPKWLTKHDYFIMDLFYEYASTLTKETGVLYEVDHTIPLQGKEISGLHCPLNLCILTSHENRTKYNKY